MIAWIVVASKYGATREIAEAMVQCGHEGQVRDAESVEDLDGAEAVVIGSAVYAGHSLKPARRLVEECAEELAARPTWLFSSGPVGDPKPEEAKPEGIAEAIEATGARGHEVFAGKLDRDALSRPERLMVRALRVPEGDFRDRAAIPKWAREIARELDEV